jgi:hypothetical protein
MVKGDTMMLQALIVALTFLGSSYQVPPPFPAVVPPPVQEARGPSFKSANFTVTAPTAEIAQQVAKRAESYRREKALLWLGKELPKWPEPCPIRVKVTMAAPSGATTFTFGGASAAGPGIITQGPVAARRETEISMHMEVSGSLDRLLNSVLPHEVTHTIFAHHFRCPVPRWADEGGALLSEDKIEHERHDKLMRQRLNQGKEMRVRSLFSLSDYPRDMDKVMTLYAEGYSVCDFLVQRKDRATFLKFVAMGMETKTNWDNAVRTCYELADVEALEAAWLKHLRDTRARGGLLTALRALSEDITVEVVSGAQKVLASAPDWDLLAAVHTHGRFTEARLLIRRLGHKRLGVPEESTLLALEAIADLERLERMAERVGEVKSWQELLAVR